MKKFFFCCVFLVFVFFRFFSGMLFANASSHSPAAGGVEGSGEFWFLEAPQEWPAQVMPGVRGGDGRFLTYIDNLIPVAGTTDSLFFADSKTVIGPHGSNEQNIGIGARGLLFDEEFIAGGNFFYDTRYTENKVRHHQLGFGLEGLTKWVDARANFYFPISDKKLVSEDTSYGFRSRSLVKMTTPTYEEALRGLDYEAGMLLPVVSEFVETRAFLGGYHYFPELSKNMSGIKGRVELRPIRALTFEVELKRDNHNGTDCFVGGFITIPLETINVFKVNALFDGFGKYFKYQKGVRPLRERMVDRVVRDIDVTTGKSVAPIEETKVHDLTYVDNSYTGVSDGSLERPYTTIQAGVNNAVGDKWVYVKEGNAIYAETVTLANNVTLWGAGHSGGFAGIPTTGAPVVDGSGADVMTLANNNTVMGFTIQNGSRGIYGIDIQNTTIRHNTITGNTGEGVHLDIGGTTAGTYAISGNSMTGNTSHGIYLLADDNANAVFHVDGNTSTGNARGIMADFKTNATGSIRISGNDMSNNTGFAGISVYPYNNSVIESVYITDNVSSNNKSHGAVVALSDNSSIKDLRVRNNIYNNSVNGSGVYLYLAGNTSIDFADISYNTTTGNKTKGIQVYIPGTSAVVSDLVISNNTVTNNGGEAIWMRSDSANLVTTTIANNTVTGNKYGINFYLKNSSSITATVYNNNVTGSTVENLGIWSQTASSFTGSFYNNVFASGGYGVIAGSAGYTLALAADFGGGALGSIGNNSIYGNTICDFQNKTVGAITAQHNWWGAAPPAAGQFDQSGAAIDYSNHLISDPN
ncbi:MAG: hypothetical protein BWY49_00199 [Candidatus Omnitrophica bacterium ADurb.Bin314]|nr:MAG: hypothetical protein BWY49_00199 [Candidatus Omnitrophica bacterium ADurb.Bin314]